MTVNTGKVPGRRVLRFDSFESLFAEVDALALAERAQRLRRIGNWTLGQALGHVAAWADYAFDGYPPDINPPWIVRFVVGFQKKSFIHQKMRAGVKIPGVQNGTKAIEVISTDEGVRRLRAAFTRLRDQAPVLPNPLFGPLSHGEWIGLNLRHCELHLSFLHPR